MKTFHNLIFAIISLTFYFILFAKVASANQLPWKQTLTINSVSQEIRFSPSESQTVFVTRRSSDGSAVYKSTNGGKDFTIVFPLSLNRDVNSIAISYQVPNTIWIGTYEQGIFKSIDGGLNWTGPTLSSVRIRSLAVDPSDDNIVYAGTGENNNDGGIYKSVDGGNSWNLVGASTYGLQNCLNVIADATGVQSPNHSQTIYAGSGSGFYRSLDEGLSWTNIEPGKNTNFTGTVIDRTNNQTIYTSVYFGGIYKTTDSGNIWLPMNNGIDGSFVMRLAQDDNGWLYGSRRSEGGGVIRSRDGGNSWENVGDSSWNNRYTWGLDVKNGRLIVSVEGLGIYIANTDGTAIDGGPTHTECRSNACAIVEGEGTNSCTTNSDCAQQVFCDNMQIWSTTGDAPLTSTFFLTGHTVNGGNLVGVRYDFGDWLNDYSQPWLAAVSHTYDYPGTYTVRGYVRDNLGNEAGGTGSCQTQVVATQAKNSVVVIPGFGGSWSTKTIVLHNQDATYRDWIMMPFKAPEIYNPFLQALETAGYAKNQKSFFFAYDFTKSITETASWLNDFLANDVLPQNLGKKVDIVAHSMGGLVARACFEQIDGCKDKINKIVTAGTPHRGAVDSYYFWEGADFLGLDRLSRYGAKLLLHIDGAPKWSEADIIHTKFIGAKDLLPFSNYIFNKPYAQLQIAQNPTLQNLPTSTEFKEKTLTLSGNRADSTSFLLTVTPANKKETASGFWVDGKPSILSRGVGDGTVLKSSSEITGALNQDYDIDHVGYLNNQLPVTNIFYYLNIPTTTLTATKGHKSATIFYSSSAQLIISLDDETATRPNSNVVFSFDTKPNDRTISITAAKDGNYTINGWYYDDQGNEKSAAATVNLLAGQKTEVKLKFN